MTTLRRIVAALRRWGSHGQAEHDLHNEIQSFAELRADELRAAGVPDAEARRRALAEMGGAEFVKESIRVGRAGAAVAQTLQDVRYAFRSLARSPGFSIIAILVLALGIGANAAIFSLVNAALLRPLPVRAPEELVYAYQLGIDGYDRLAQRRDLFATMTGSAVDLARLRVGDEVTQIRGAAVLANYLEVLGVVPAFGRTFTAAESSMAAAPSVMISHDLWTRQFNGAQGIIGTTIDLEPGVGGYTTERGRSYTVIGIAPEGFRGTGSPWEPTEYWVPLQQRAADYTCADPTYLPRAPIVAIGRLAAGVKFVEAAAFVRTLSASKATTGPGAKGPVLSPSRRSRLPFGSLSTMTASPLAAALMAVSGLVLIIAAANLVGLFMARSITRRADTAIRLTLGAGRRRIVRQWLTESLLLSLMGGLGGLALARALVQLFLVNLPSSFGAGSNATRVSLEVPVDLRVLTFTAVVCLVAGLLVGVIPARQASQTDVLSSLSGSATSAPRRGRSQMRRWILIPQVALSLTLLLVAGVLVRALLTQEWASPGYTAEGVVSVEYQVPVPPGCQQSPATYADLRSRRLALRVKLLAGLAQDAQLTSAALSHTVPSGSSPFVGAVVTPEGFASGAHRAVRRDVVSPDYLRTLGINLVRGRQFTDADMSGGPPVAIVSRSLADVLWPGADPIGQRLAVHHPSDPPPASWSQVVGIVDDVQPEWADGGPNLMVYEPLQSSDIESLVVARTAGSPADAIKSITALLKQADPAVNIVQSRALTSQVAELRFSRRVVVAIVVAAGLIGMLLATIGLYGVIAHSLSQRQRELGIRVALGADRHDLMRLVLSEGAFVIVAGSVIGTAFALVAVGIVSHRVLAIPPMDWPTLIVVPVILAVVVLLTCYVPARRASRIDPIRALRNE